MERHHVLPGREPLQVRDPDLDDEAPAGLQVCGNVAEAGHLRFL